MHQLDTQSSWIYIYIYIYICIFHNYKLILLVTPHTHKKKNLLKLYLLLNYNISDNHRVGQGKKFKKKKKKKKKHICLLVTSSIQADLWSFLASFKDFPVLSEGSSRLHPGFVLCFSSVVKGAPRFWVQDSSFQHGVRRQEHSLYMLTYRT